MANHDFSVLFMRQCRKLAKLVHVVGNGLFQYDVVAQIKHFFRHSHVQPVLRGDKQHVAVFLGKERVLVVISVFLRNVEYFAVFM